MSMHAHDYSGLGRLAASQQHEVILAAVCGATEWRTNDPDLLALGEYRAVQIRPLGEA